MSPVAETCLCSVPVTVTCDPGVSGQRCAVFPGHSGQLDEMRGRLVREKEEAVATERRETAARYVTSALCQPHCHRLCPSLCPCLPFRVSCPISDPGTVIVTVIVLSLSLPGSL